MSGDRLSKRSKQKSTSIWVDPIEWKKFLVNTKKTGQSSCHVLDAFIYGFNRSLEKAGGPVLHSLPTINLNLTVVRGVKRYRRRTPELSEEEYLEERERIRIKRKEDKEYIEAYKKAKLRRFWNSFSKPHPLDPSRDYRTK